MNRPVIKSSILDFDFKKIFNELGWDNHSQEHVIQLNEKTYKLRAVANKKEFVAFVCLPDEDGKIPDYQIRKKLETKVTPFAFEHIIIFYDEKKSVQIWQWVKREHGKPTATRETPFHSHQNPEMLLQKLHNLEITLEEEESIGITDVRGKTKNAFDVVKVTKEFYTRFKTEHDVFQNFIQGISEEVDMDWYSSLMLNRLMFIYFIQKKHFLDDDPDYLKNKLNEVQQKNGKDKFHSFYRTFLLELFHNGLGSSTRNPELIKLLGRIPYLNGGLFDVHQLEQKYDKIDIPDKAFEKVFEFFDKYEWHLDTRVKAKGNEINPDVIGYIFEKYINDRASMGAYYTQEDITDYISKNCIIPFLYDETIRNYKDTAFDDAFVMFRENPDRYIYPAVKHGISLKASDKIPYSISDEELFADLPDDIKIGFNSKLEKKVVDGIGEYLCDLRKAWNKPAPSDIALPTEIYREVIERRKRYKEIFEKAKNGEINSINDFITYNLNIRQFFQDIIENTNDPLLLKELYKAIKKITILDPTCGSGAFLFAAMNILEPLYEACIQRMRNFVNDAKLEYDKKVIKFFEDTISEIDSPQHPNEKYFIYKSIILNNLHGVDIMNEAVEIAKLRLFLKLVSTVEPDQSKDNLGLEPLPDIDFNIRAGNTLVGFVTETEATESLQTDQLDFYSEINQRISDTLAILKKKDAEFKSLQANNAVSTEIKKKKEEIISTKTVIHELLNLGLAKVYGIDPHDSKRLNQWRTSHQPFHWFFEFPEIMNKENGGFDVIIGNPPYVEYKEVQKFYRIIDDSILCGGNLHSFVVARSSNLSSKFTFSGFIVPVSICNTDRMLQIRQLLNSTGSIWVSNYAIRPGRLFNGAEQRLSIFIHNRNYEKHNIIRSTKYYKWNKNERDELFDKLSYNAQSASYDIWIKVPDIIVDRVFQKIHISDKFVKNRLLGSIPMFYKNTGVGYYINATQKPPLCYINGIKTSSSRETTLNFNTIDERNIFHSIFTSSLFFIFYQGYSNCRDLNPSDLLNYKIPMPLISDKRLVDLSNKLQDNMSENSWFQIRNQTQTGEVKIQSFTISQSKPILDKIDKVLSEHYGFTQEELDFIINYDIKYRMGKELEEGE